MAKIKQSPKLPPQERRQQLLTAAHRLFMKHGYRGTSTAQIAEEAGLTKGALYHHFHAKEDILFELVRLKHRQLIDALQALPHREGQPADLLKVLLDSIPEAGFADFGNYLDFWVQAARITKIRDFLNECIDEYDRVFAERIDHDFARTRQDRHDLAVMILALRDGLTVRKMLGHTVVDFPRQLRLFASLVEGKMTHDTSKESKSE